MHPLWLSIVSSVCGAGRFNRSHRYKSLQALVDFLSSAPFLKMSYPGFNETFTATLILWAIVGCSGGRECKLVSKLTCYSICWIFHCTAETHPRLYMDCPSVDDSSSPQRFLGRPKLADGTLLPQRQAAPPTT